MMVPLIMDHGVSGYFGPSLAPRKVELTRGLGNSESPTSDSLTPQETTKQGDAEVGVDGACLSCPGSSVAADSQGEAVRLENTSIPETIVPDRPSS